MTSAATSPTHPLPNGTRVLIRGVDRYLGGFCGRDNHPTIADNGRYGVIAASMTVLNPDDEDFELYEEEGTLYIYGCVMETNAPYADVLDFMCFEVVEAPLASSAV